MPELLRQLKTNRIYIATDALEAQEDMVPVYEDELELNDKGYRYTPLKRAGLVEPEPVEPEEEEDVVIVKKPPSHMNKTELQDLANEFGVNLDPQMGRPQMVMAVREILKDAEKAEDNE